jgi:hypothetical protein
VITVEVVFTEEFVFCQVSFVRVQLLGLLVLPVDLMPVDLFSGYCFRWPPPSQAFWLGFVRVHCQQSVDPDLAGGSQRLPARDEWHRINFPSALFLPARFFFFCGLPARFYFAQAPSPFLQFTSLRWDFPGACVLGVALNSDLRWIFAIPLYLFSSAALLVS